MIRASERSSVRAGIQGRADRRPDKTDARRRDAPMDVSSGLEPEVIFLVHRLGVDCFLWVCHRVRVEKLGS